MYNGVMMSHSSDDKVKLWSLRARIPQQVRRSQLSIVSRVGRVTLRPPPSSWQDGSHSPLGP